MDFIWGNGARLFIGHRGHVQDGHWIGAGGFLIR